MEPLEPPVSIRHIRHIITNGGQLPFGSKLLQIADEIPENHQRGWVQENRTPMLISRGVGTVRLPIRIGCQPQIHLITVRSGN